MGSGRERIVNAEFISLHPQKRGQHCDSIECVALLEVLACSVRKQIQMVNIRILIQYFSEDNEQESDCGIFVMILIVIHYVTTLYV